MYPEECATDILTWSERMQKTDSVPSTVAEVCLRHVGCSAQRPMSCAVVQLST